MRHLTRISKSARGLRAHAAQRRVLSDAIASCPVITEALERRMLMTVFMVTDSGDNGGVNPAVGAATGTLRQAIVDSNADTAAANIIHFAIGTGIQTITPETPLPKITHTVLIDGTSQPGFAGSPIVVLDGEKLPDQPGGAPPALDFASGSDVSTVEGLVINQFKATAISLDKVSNVSVVGNYIGTDVLGTTAKANYEAVSIDGQKNTVGGITVAARNIISGNGDGITVFGASNTIEGNYIGTDVTGTKSLGSQNPGIYLQDTSNNVIGGITPAARNIISGNTLGVQLNSSNSNVIEGNYIGTDATGSSPIPNSTGIAFFGGSSGNVVGGSIAADGNTIAYNTNAGVLVGSAVSDSSMVLNAVRLNSIYRNGTIGIDLNGGAATQDGDGITPNSPGSPHSGPNHLQSFPFLASAVSNGTTTTIQGTLNSTPNAPFVLDFYSNTALDSNGTTAQGKTYIGSVSVNSDGSGNASFNTTLSAAVPAGQYITATATTLDSLPPGDTSEFGLPVQVVAPAPPTPTPTPSPTTLNINAGGSAVGSFAADEDFTGGKTFSTGDTIVTSGVTNPPPQQVYQTERYGTFTYTVPGLTAGSPYTVRLDFDEMYWNAAGKRLFNVTINGTAVLSNFDIFSAAGGKDKAVAQTFNATADSGGRITIGFITLKDNAKVDGIEITSGSSPTPTPTPTPSPTPTSLKIDSGGPTDGSYVADVDYSGGNTFSTGHAIDTSVAGAAPRGVYQTERYGNFSYTAGGLTAGASYSVKLHFAEIYWNAAGKRVFNVSINGTQVLGNFDIFATAGAFKAVIESFTAVADSGGKIVISFGSVKDNAKVSGIELTPM